MKKSVMAFWLTFTMLLTLPGASAAGDEAVAAAPAPASSDPAPATASSELGGYSTDLEAAWREFLAQRGLVEGPNPGDVYVFHASAIVGVPLGQPGWIQSRVSAFEQAELEARAAMAHFIGDKVSTRRQLELLARSAWSVGSTHQAKRLKKAAATLERLTRKGTLLVEKRLDNAIADLDPDYDPGRYADETERLAQLERTVTHKVSIASQRLIVGASVFHTAEGGDESGYEVSVGIIWSPRLNRLAMSIASESDNLPPGPPGAPIESQLPASPETIVGAFGTRILLDEHGKRVIVAYGQAEPVRSDATWRRAAEHGAMRVAETLARAYIARFLSERIRDELELNQRELLRRFGDGELGVDIASPIDKTLSGRTAAHALRGLVTVRRWLIAHPRTNQPMAVAAVAWSPGNAALAVKMRAAIAGKALAMPSPGAAPTKPGVEKVYQGPGSALAAY